MMKDPRPTPARLHDIQKRLEAVPEYLRSLLARLDTPIERWISIDREKVAGLGSLFESVIAWSRTEGYLNQGALESAALRAEKALTGYLEALKRLPHTRQLHLDRETAERIVKLRGIDLGFDELQGIARNFLDRVAVEIDDLAERLKAKYGLASDTSVKRLESYLNRRFRVIDEDGDLALVLERYREELQKVTRFVEQRGLFDLLADERIEILRTPKFMEPSIPAGAMLSPAPFSKSTPTSFIYLTLAPELLDEHTLLSIPSMIIHEAIPGHHLQLASAALHPSSIRRHVDAMEQAEGWTTMLEDYMLDLGYMGDLTDEARFIGKRDISRIGARVAIDLFFMTGEKGFLEVGVDCDLSPDDPFVAAGNLLSKVTGFTPGRVEAELNWYSQEHGYPLSYLAGNHLVWELKRDLQASQRGTIDGLDLDRVFHRAYLKAGNMPLTFLRRSFQHQGLLSA
jgi:uncharacterized protein (DUF885 family)